MSAVTYKATAPIDDTTPDSVVGIVGVLRGGVWYYSVESDALLVGVRVPVATYRKRALFPSAPGTIPTATFKKVGLVPAVPLATPPVASKRIMALPVRNPLATPPMAVFRKRALNPETVLSYEKSEITIDGISLSDYGFNVNSISGRSDIPSSQRESEDILSCEFALLVGDEIGELKEIIVKGKITGGMSWADLLNKERQIKQVFFDRGFLQVLFGDQPLYYWLARVTGYTSEEVGAQETGKWATITMSAYPYTISRVDFTHVVENGSPSGGGTNNGNIDTWPIYILEVTQSLSGCYVEIGLAKLTVTDSLVAGDIIEIDTSEQTVEKNNININEKITGDFPSMPPGAYTVVKTQNGISLQVKYRERII